MRVGMHEATEHGQPENLDIESDRPVADVEQVELDALPPEQPSKLPF